jgi:pimeloyl-ACP methyl ester carboxylesterase
MKPTRRTIVLSLALCCHLAGCATASKGEFTETWRKEGQIQTVQLDNGFTLRYLKTGSGRPLILLHTIRTQLDYFEKLIPELKSHYQIYALDLPGHGQSSLPPVDYTEPLLRQSVVQFIQKLNLHDVTLVGESIGGVLSLTVAGELPDRVTRVVSLNPYDYGEKFGGGIRRSSNGWIVSLFNVFGCHTIETRFALAAVLRGGFYDEKQLPDDLLSEFHRAGEREGLRCAEYSTFANWKSWVEAKSLYARVKAPVSLIYGSQDWSKPSERLAERALFPNAEFIVLDRTGHFSSLENPAAVRDVILGGSNAERQP